MRIFSFIKHWLSRNYVFNQKIENQKEHRRVRKTIYPYIIEFVTFIINQKYYKNFAIFRDNITSVSKAYCWFSLLIVFCNSDFLKQQIVLKRFFEFSQWSCQLDEMEWSKNCWIEATLSLVNQWCYHKNQWKKIIEKIATLLVKLLY